MPDSDESTEVPRVRSLRVTQDEAWTVYATPLRCDVMVSRCVVRNNDAAPFRRGYSSCQCPVPYMTAVAPSSEIHLCPLGRHRSATFYGYCSIHTTSGGTVGVFLNWGVEPIENELSDSSHSGGGGGRDAQ